MSSWWRKGVGTPIDNENFIKIIDFYLLHCPVEKKTGKVSQIAEVFEDRGWKDHAIADFVNEMKFLCTDEMKFNHIEKENIYDKVVEEENNSTTKNKNFELIFFKDICNSQAKSIFYCIRNAFAHGAFSVVANKGDPIYYFESERFGDIKGMIRLKEQTLLSWIDLFHSTPEELKEKQKKRKEELNKQKEK